MEESAASPGLWLLATRGALLLLAGAICVYALYGIKAFRIELKDFNPTPDDATAHSATSARALSSVAEVVGWELSDGTTQRAFYRPSANGATIVYLHGAPGSAAGFHRMVAGMGEQGFGSVVLDLPGYGASEGPRNWGESYDETVTRALDFVATQEGDGAKIGGFGYSMGAPLIVRAAASDRRLSAIVLLAGFTNLEEQLHRRFQRRLPGMGYFGLGAAIWSGVDVGRLDTLKALEASNPRPTFVIAGAEDAQVPPTMAVELRDAAGEGSEVWIVPGVGHYGFDDVLGQHFYDRLAEFWSRVLLASPNQGSTIRSEERELWTRRQKGLGHARPHPLTAG